MHMTTQKVVKLNVVILSSNIPVKGNQVHMLVIFFQIRRKKGYRL